MNKDNAENWSVHTTSDGKKYFFNKVTQKTQWEKPAVLKSAEEREAGTCVWKEYASDNGKKYFYNNVTGESVWEMPKELREFMDRQKKTARAARKEEEAPKVVLTDRQKFRTCLLQHGMTHTWNVDQAMQTTKSDERWKLLKMAEKKQVFFEVSRELNQQHRDAKMRKEREMQQDFINMLIEHKDIDEAMHFRDAMDLVKLDRRYIVIASDRERGRLFEKFHDEKIRRERQVIREKRREKRERFKAFLQQDKEINVRTQWRRFKEKHQEEAFFVDLEPLDRLSLFEDHILHLERIESDKFKRIKLEARTKGRKAREKFRHFLHEKADAGEITLSTRWKDFVKTIKFESAYLGMMDVIGHAEQQRSTPAELFCDFLDDLEDRMYADKKRVKDMLSDVIGFEMKVTTTFEEFSDAIKSHEKFGIINPANLPFIHADFVSKSEKKRAEEKEEAMQELQIPA